MRNYEKGTGGGEAKKDLESMHGIIERIRDLEHPDWPRKDDDISALKAAIESYTRELEHLNYRYEARGAELEKLKAQHTDLERLCQLRPDTMRRVGEMELTELVRKKQELAGLELTLQKAKADLEVERARQARDAKERVETRLAEIERENSERKKRLDSAERENAARESAILKTETRLREQLEAARRRAIDGTAAAFDGELAAREGLFAQERSILKNETETWRRKAAQALAQLAEAGKKLEAMEKELQAAGEMAGKKLRLTESDMEARLKRLAELEKESSGLEQRNAELSRREETCGRLEEELKRKAQEFRERTAALEKDYKEKKKYLEAAKTRMRVEIDDLVRQYRGE